MLLLFATDDFSICRFYPVDDSKELEEAARIDGAGTLRVFFTVVFPLLKPITASVLIIACVYIWNDYQFAIFFLQDKEMHTLTVALSNFFGQNQHQLQLVGAAALIAMLPMVTMFYFCKNTLSQGCLKALLKGNPTLM